MGAKRVSLSLLLHESKGTAATLSDSFLRRSTPTRSTIPSEDGSMTMLGSMTGSLWTTTPYAVQLTVPADTRLSSS